MKAVGLNVDTGEVREFDTKEEALAYAKAAGYESLDGGIFPQDAKDDVIAAAKAAFGTPKSDVKLSDYDRGVRDILWALAHMFKDQGDQLVALKAARYADFELMHSLADAIKSGEATGSHVVSALREQRGI
jgi:hypothetical protein